MANVKVKQRARRTPAVFLASKRFLLIGDTVNFAWGDAMRGGHVQITKGIIFKLMSDGHFSVKRTKGRKNAHSHIRNLKFINGRKVTSSDCEIWKGN